MYVWKHVLFVIYLVVRLNAQSESSLPYVWPLPAKAVSGSKVVSVDHALSLVTSGLGGKSQILKLAFLRYKKIIFKHATSSLRLYGKGDHLNYDITNLSINVRSDNEELQLEVDESYTLFVEAKNGSSIIEEVSIDANTVYGALRGLETFSQLCIFDFSTKKVQIYNAPWYIEDKPRFHYRGLLIDSSRHFLPIEVIKGVIESMSYAKLNVLHWHILDEQAFPMEIQSYPKLWDGSYTKWERYTVEDAREIVEFAKMRGINVMAEVDVPGHAESWGVGYPDLWPSRSCREPLDVSKSFTFDVIDGILTDLRKIFPFALFHLGGDEVDTSCWGSTAHIKQWMEERNTTAEGAYHYFVLQAQKLAISKKWTPVNWEETFTHFGSRLSPETVVHNWLRDGVCKEAVAKGLKCIFSNQRNWYLDHLDVPWERVYGAEPLEGIEKASEQALVIGGEVCMWGETADASVIQQTIWPRAAAAAERLWSNREATSSGNGNESAQSRLHLFRCVLTQRGVPAAPLNNDYARQPPLGPASCFAQ